MCCSSMQKVHFSAFSGFIKHISNVKVIELAQVTESNTKKGPVFCYSSISDIFTINHYSIVILHCKIYPIHV